MAKQKTKHITVTIDGVEKILYRVFLQKDGSPTVMPIPLGYLRAPGQNRDENAPKLNGTKYSLHMSENSPTHNIIKHTTTTASGEVTRVHATRSIKGLGRLAYIGSRRFSNLVSDKFNSDTKPQDKTNLCEYDPKKWNMFVHLAWSRIDRGCDAAALKAWSYEVLKFDTTELHIFFRFLAIPATPTAYDFSHMTIHPKHLNGNVTQSEYGFGDLELAQWFRLADGQMDEELISMIINACGAPSHEAQQAFREWCSLGWSRNMSNKDIVANAGGSNEILAALDKMEKYRLNVKYL